LAALPPLLKRLLGKPTTTAADPGIPAFFQAKARQQGYTLSPSQQQVVDAMARQTAQLLAGRATRSLYLHGAVGRGKSWLLDGFFQALPLAEKQRVHFHDFFARLHQGMFAHRHQRDALAVTLDALLAGCRVLFFGGFHLHDVGDALERESGR